MWNTSAADAGVGMAGFHGHQRGNSPRRCRVFRESPQARVAARRPVPVAKLKEHPIPFGRLEQIEARACWVAPAGGAAMRLPPSWAPPGPSHSGPFEFPGALSLVVHDPGCEKPMALSMVNPQVCGALDLRAPSGGEAALTGVAADGFHPGFDGLVAGFRGHIDFLRLRSSFCPMIVAMLRQ